MMKNKLSDFKNFSQFSMLTFEFVPPKTIFQTVIQNLHCDQMGWEFLDYYIIEF